MKNQHLGVDAEYGDQEYIITLFLQRKLQYILCIINKRELLDSPPMGPSPSHQSSWWFTETPVMSGHSWVMVGVSSAEMQRNYEKKNVPFCFLFIICGTTNLLQVSGNFAVTVLSYTSVIFLKYQTTIALKYIWKEGNSLLKRSRCCAWQKNIGPAGPFNPTVWNRKMHGCMYKC